jgi:Ca2+-binding RTX toxin-like protein
MSATRRIRSGAVTAALVGSLVAAWTSPARAPQAGEPPAPGYPPCTKVGDDGDNVLKGTKHRDVICADEGNDVVYGRGGNDVLFGGPGVDRIYGEAGADEIHGWLGQDRIFGDSGSDQLNGEIGDDLVVGGSGADLLIGAEGGDCLVATYGLGNDELKGNLGFDRYEADPGDEVNGSNEQASDCWAHG